MDKYIGIGFIILCLSVLVGILGIFRYQFTINNEKTDISPATNISQSNNTTYEYGLFALILFIIYNIFIIFSQYLL